MNRAWKIAAALALVALVASCAPASKASKLKVAMVVSNAFGDKSFFDSAKSGLDRAQAEFGYTVSTTECHEDINLYAGAITAAAENHDVIIVMGYQFFELVQQTSRSYPDKKFIYVDANVQEQPNLAVIDFTESEGSYLAGVLAALGTVDPNLPKTNPEKKVGIVGGMDIPVIRAFVEGFLAGVKDTDPEVEAFVSFAGSFEDTEPAATAARAQIAAGADILFVAAGGAGLGALAACKDADVYAIGVDQDQRPLDPERILASIVKDTGQAVYTVLKEIAEDSFKGGLRRYGLAQSFVGLDWGDDPSPVPAALRQDVDAVAAKVMDGSLRLELLP